MNIKIYHFKLVAWIIIFTSCRNLYAQQPDISYQTPPVFIVSQTINPVVPNNTGGAIPSNKYHQVITYGSGYSSSIDGIRAAASFSMPSGIGIDANDNIYVGDRNSGAIRKITSNGIVSTIQNVNTPNSLTVDQQGNIYVSSADDRSIYKINTAGVKSVFVAGLNNPGGLYIDNTGNLYVADQGNNKIRKITPAGTVTTIAGTGSAGSTDGSTAIATFDRPDDVVADKQGNVFVADAANNKIRKITPNGEVSTFAGSNIPGSTNGIGTNARLNYPTGLAIDDADNLYVADYGNNRIRKITPNGEVSTLVGPGAMGGLNGIGLKGPIMLVCDASGNLYITEYMNNLVRKISLTGYTIDKPLPAGLNFDGNTGIISGTPAMSSPATIYTITAYNVYGKSSASIEIKVILSDEIIFPGLPDKTMCDADFAPGATSDLPVTYTSSNTAVAEIINGKIHIVSPGTSIITASNGIPGKEQTQTLAVSPLGKPYANIVMSPNVACEGMPITFSIAQTDGKEGNNPTFTWMINGQAVENDDIKFVSSTLKNGDKVTCIITNNDYCVPASSGPSNTLVANVLSNSNASVNISASPTGSVCAGIPITFTAKPSQNVQGMPVYQWFVNNKSVPSKGPVFTSTTLKDGDIITCIMQSNSICIINPEAYSNPLTAHIKSDCEIQIPNSFTPNSDGINDTWNIVPLSQNAYVKVFNRNGHVVFQSVGYGTPWDGTSSGKPLPTGTYYYIITDNNGAKKRSGYVAILR